MTREPIRLDPGPVTVHEATRAALATGLAEGDGAGGGDVRGPTRRVLRRLLALAGGSRAHAAVLVAGGATEALAAAIASFVPPGGRLLALQNGPDGQRLARLADTLGRRMVTVAVPEDRPIDPIQVASVLVDEPDITHVAVAHCEAGTGLLNPVDGIAAVVRDRGRRLIVDAIASFGAVPLDIGRWPADAVVAAPEGGLEGVPGFGFVFSTPEALAAAAGNAAAGAPDLGERWQGQQASGPWPFAPPAGAVAALHRALDLLDAEGGPAARQARYRANLAALLEGLAGLGLAARVPAAVQAPVVVAVQAPADPAFDPARLRALMARRGFLLPPARGGEADGLRIGCIGAIDADTIRRAVAALGEALDDLGVVQRAPAATAASRP